MRIELLALVVAQELVAGDAVALGLDEVFIDLGQMCTTTAEMLDAAGAFLAAVRPA